MVRPAKIRFWPACVISDQRNRVLYPRHLRCHFPCLRPPSTMRKIKSLCCYAPRNGLAPSATATPVSVSSGTRGSRSPDNFADLIALLPEDKEAVASAPPREGFVYLLKGPTCSWSCRTALQHEPVAAGFRTFRIPRSPEVHGSGGLDDSDHAFAAVSDDISFLLLSRRCERQALQTNWPVSGPRRERTFRGHSEQTCRFGWRMSLNAARGWLQEVSIAGEGLSASLHQG